MIFKNTLSESLSSLSYRTDNVIARACSGIHLHSTESMDPAVKPRDDKGVEVVRVISLSLLLTLIIIKPGSALAFKGGEFIEVTSDNLIVDDQNLFASFKGSVTVTFEDMILKTDYLKIHYANNKGKKSIDKIEIPGKLRAIKTSCQEVVVADSGEYNASLNELLLNGNVRVQKDNNILITNKMIYITKLKSLSQKSDEN